MRFVPCELSDPRQLISDISKEKAAQSKAKQQKLQNFTGSQALISILQTTYDINDTDNKRNCTYSQHYLSYFFFIYHLLDLSE